MNDDLKTAMNEFRARAALQAFATQPVNPAVVAPIQRRPSRRVECRLRALPARRCR